MALGNNKVVRSRSRLPFNDGKQDSLKNGLHSLQAIPRKNQLHREFITFNSKDVNIEYLVALKRKKTYCKCGVEATVRNVVKRSENHRRTFLFCGKKPEIWPRIKSYYRSVIEIVSTEHQQIGR